MPYLEPQFLPWDGRRVPITFVGGYLGAGKTTAINQLLAHTDRPVAVIVNDVGAVNIDAALIRRRHGDTIELTNGCVCCGSIEELGAAFDLIRSRPQPPDHLVIELSGVAEPARMLPWSNSAGFMLDGLVIVVAADQVTDADLPDWIRAHLDDQIRAAHLLVLTKTDLLGADHATAAHARLAELAPATPVLRTGNGPLDPGALGRFLALGARRPAGGPPAPPVGLFDAHRAQLLAPPAGLTVDGLRQWVATLPERLDGQLVRAKGLVDTIDAGLVLVQVVGRRMEITAVPPPERQPPTELVVITLA